MKKLPSKIEKISGFPVWKLTGVNSKNSSLIEKTDLWIHYTKLANKGWGLVAPLTIRNAFAAKFGKHGIKIEPWKKLPSVEFLGLKVRCGFGIGFIKYGKVVERAIRESDNFSNAPTATGIAGIPGLIGLAAITAREFFAPAFATATPATSSQSDFWDISGSDDWHTSSNDWHTNPAYSHMPGNIHYSSSSSNDWPTSSDDSHTSFPDYITDPIYSYMPQNIFHSTTSSSDDYHSGISSSPDYHTDPSYSHLSDNIHHSSSIHDTSSFHDTSSSHDTSSHDPFDSTSSYDPFRDH